MSGPTPAQMLAVMAAQPWISDAVKRCALGAALAHGAQGAAERSVVLREVIETVDARLAFELQATFGPIEREALAPVLAFARVSVSAFVAAVAAGEAAGLSEAALRHHLDRALGAVVGSLSPSRADDGGR